MAEILAGNLVARGLATLSHGDSDEKFSIQTHPMLALLVRIDTTFGSVISADKGYKESSILPAGLRRILLLSTSPAFWPPKSER